MFLSGKFQITPKYLTFYFALKYLSLVIKGYAAQHLRNTGMQEMNKYPAHLRAQKENVLNKIIDRFRGTLLFRKCAII